MRCLAQDRAGELLQGVRQRGARRQEADRRGACSQINFNDRVAGDVFAGQLPTIAVQGEGRMDRFIRTITLVSQACGIFAAGLIGAAVLVVCHMVFVRYALNHNTIWQTDFTISRLVAATFIGTPYVLLTRAPGNWAAR